MDLADDFPILSTMMHGKRIVYLDSASTSQKPRQVIEALRRHYESCNANIHRGIYELSEKATRSYEEVRDLTAEFIGAKDRREIIFTRNTTESINLVAYSWARGALDHGDEILSSEIEHHSNLVPWQLAAKYTGATLRHLKLKDDGTLDMNGVTGKTMIVAVTGMSNVLGTIVPVKKLADEAHKAGALILVDGAQLVPHMPVDVGDLDCDFLAFSAHKMLGPTGVGILWGRREILESMDPFIAGGEMISRVSFDRAEWNELPWKFEAGTPCIGEVIAFGEALRYLKKIGMAKVREHEKRLTRYALKRMESDGRIELYGPLDPELRGGVISFNFGEIHAHDAATILDAEGIALRAGHHCAMPLMKKLNVSATLRASFYIYNSEEDIDRLMDGLDSVEKVFGKQSRQSPGRIAA